MHLRELRSVVGRNFVDVGRQRIRFGATRWSGERPSFNRGSRCGNVCEREEEPQLDIADLHLIAVVEACPAVDRHSVQIGSVAASQILKEEITMPIEDLGMLPTDERIVEDNLAARMATQHGPLAAQMEPLHRIVPFSQLEESHG